MNITIYRNGKPANRQYAMTYEYMPIYEYETVKPVITLKQWLTEGIAAACILLVPMLLLFI